MFDDLKKDGQGAQASNTSQAEGKQDSSQDQSPKAVSGQGAVDDMFGDVDPAPEQKSFSPALDKESAVQSGKMKPASQNQSLGQNKSQPDRSPGNQGPVVPPSGNVVVEEENMGLGKKIFVALAVIVLVGLIGGAIYYFVIRPNQTNNTTLNINQNSNTIENTNPENNIPVNENIVPPGGDNTTFDDDQDGLTNAEEEELGTSPFEADTDNDGVFDQDEVEVYNTDPLTADSDGDGLNDYQEIIIWRTDPMAMDSDGDGYSDGVEVDNGYNPNGPGLIEGIEENINTNINVNSNENTNSN